MSADDGRFLVLRDALVQIAIWGKADHDYATLLGSEVAALRDALDELNDGKFLPVERRHRTRHVKLAAAATQGDAQNYTDLIRRLGNLA
jgi:hypothetical protein